MEVNEMTQPDPRDVDALVERLTPEYARWLSSIEVDVRVHDLTAGEVARLVAAITERTDDNG